MKIMDNIKFLKLLGWVVLVLFFTFGLLLCRAIAADGGVPAQTSSSSPPAGVPGWLFWVVSFAIPAFGLLVERLTKMLSTLREIVAKGIPLRLVPEDKTELLDGVEQRQKAVCGLCKPAPKNGAIAGVVGCLLLFFLCFGGCTPSQQKIAVDYSSCVVKAVAPALLQCVSAMTLEQRSSALSIERNCAKEKR